MESTDNSMVSGPHLSRLTCRLTGGTCSRALAALVAAVILLAAAPAAADYQPRVAIVMCEDSYAEDWYASHSSSQALVGLAGLAGVPYRTLTLGELIAETAPAYSSIWFSSCLFVSQEDINGLVDVLDAHVSAGGSVFLDGPLATFYRDADGMEVYRNMDDTFPFLGVSDNGWHPVAEYRVHTTASAHPVAAAAGHPAEAQLTQGIPYGTETFVPSDDTDPGSDILLELVAPDGTTTYPYLVVTEPGSSARVAAIGAYGNYVGPAAPFRNQEPSGFYDNQLLPYLIEVILWLVGPDGEPFVGLQLSHAPMTAVGRLDGDWSETPEATEATFNYLNIVARETGVATVYGIVSSFAESAGWQGFRDTGATLQSLGGSIGSHSRTHINQMSDMLDSDGWAAEVGGSLDEIRDALTDSGFAPDAYAFINPGNTIQSRDYGEFFADIDLYMTHGFETITPYATGIMGFGLPAGVAPTPVINNTPAPDFQWLYLPEWGYTVQQAAALQAMILDYYQHTVGRGVLYNQMWHDYAISDLDAPPNDPDAATIKPLFDVSRVHFAAERIYAPAVGELVGKMHLAQKVDILGTQAGDMLEVTLDYQSVPAGYREHTSGMGARLNASDQPIAEVTIDGAPHFAFTETTVLLPPADAASQQLTLRLGDPPGDSVRLTYVSKAFADIALEGDELRVWPRDPELATRFCVAGPDHLVVTGADRFERQGGEFCGSIDHGNQADSFAAQHLDTGEYDLYVVASERRILQAAWTAGAAALTVAPGPAGSMTFATAVAPESVRVDGDPVTVDVVDGAFTLDLPPAGAGSDIDIDIRMPELCLDEDGDGVTTCDMDCDDSDADVGVMCPSGVDSDAGGCGCTATAPGRGSAGTLVLFLIACFFIQLIRRHPARA